MANVLPHEKRLAVLTALVNCNGPRATSRMTGVHQDTIARFAFAVGLGCVRLHDRLVRAIACSLLDMDEQHSWCGKRQVHFNPETDDPALVGEQWTWASICRTAKLIIAWHVGKRDADSADILVANTRARLCTMPQITTDGCALYIEPIGKHFGYGVDYAQTVKRYSGSRNGKSGVAEKFAVPHGVDFIEKRTIFGAPDLDKATTYAIERSNLNNRTWNSRMVRRTLCFSKRVDHHAAAVALGYVYRNLCHIPRNMRETAAMAADITDYVWSIDELMTAALAEPAGEKPVPVALTFRQPATTARELPGERGFLRIVGGTPAGALGGPAAPPPAPMPPAAPTVAAAGAGAFSGPVQMDLLGWTPREAPPAKPLPPRGTQMDLF